MSNNYRIIYYDHLNEVANHWERIYDQSSLSYFCSLAWHRVVLAFLRKTLITKRINQLKYFTVSNAKEVEVVGFFYIRKQKKKRTIIFGHLLGPSDYYDFIYTSGTVLQNNDAFLQKILEDQQASGFRINHLKNGSPLYEAGSNKNRARLDPIKCVSIWLPEEYGSYLNLLSKNSKQNLRTAQNRLKRDNLTAEFILHSKKDKDKIDFGKLKALYYARNKNKLKASWKSRVYVKLDSLFMGYPDMFDFQETKDTDFNLGMLEINGRLASYFFGFKRNDIIEINRVTIVDEFKFYSPGILLFNQFIKQQLEQGLKVVDLTVGDEKYKYDLGGKTHEVFNITFEK